MKEGKPPIQNDDALLAPILSLTKQLAQLDDREVEAELVEQFVAAMKEVLEKKGFKFEDDVNSIYKKYNNKTILMRKESPVKLLKAIIGNNPLELSFGSVTGHKYPNCALWNNADKFGGLNNAIKEGRFDLGGVVTIIGFREDPGDELEIHDIETREQKNIGGIDRSLVRCAEGKIKPEQIEFIIMRSPADRVPYNLLSRDERDKLSDYEEIPDKNYVLIPQVFRGFSSEAIQ